MQRWGIALGATGALGLAPDRSEHLVADERTARAHESVSLGDVEHRHQVVEKQLFILRAVGAPFAAMTIDTVAPREQRQTFQRAVRGVGESTTLAPPLGYDQGGGRRPEADGVR